MNLPDRKQFDTELEILFGAFAGRDAFLSDAKREAYWRGLGKMHVSVFVRCVEHVMRQQETEPDDKPPTVAGIWKISRALRASADAPEAKSETNFDDFHRFGQIELLKILLRNRGVSAAAMPALIERKNRLVDEFRATYGGDRDRVTDPEWDQWREIFSEALQALHVPPSFEELEETRRSHCAQRKLPFTPRDRAAWERWDASRGRASEPEQPIEVPA